MPRVTPDPPGKRREAAVAIASYGNSKAASEVCGVPASTLRMWRNSDPEFQQLMAQAESEFGERIKADLAKIASLAGAETIDRLQNGDEVIVNGEDRRVRMRGKDTAIVGAVAIDKLRLLQGQPTRITADLSVPQKLARIMQQFQELAGSYEQQRVVAVQEPTDS